jgi:hypothetical protein
MEASMADTLKIQPNAYAAAYFAVGVEPFDTAALRYQSAIDAAAPLIVAAELERLAEGLHTSCHIDDLLGTAEAAARNGVRNELLARASELRGEG